MVSFLKSLHDVLQSMLAGVPESIRIVLDFIWKARWFAVGLWVSLVLYTMMMKVLPFLLWSWVIKSTLGSLLSIFASF